MKAIDALLVIEGVVLHAWTCPESCLREALDVLRREVDIVCELREVMSDGGLGSGDAGRRLCSGGALAPLGGGG